MMTTDPGLCIWLDSHVRSAEAIYQLIVKVAEAQGWQLCGDLAADSPVPNQFADMQPLAIILLADHLPGWLAAVRANPATWRLPVVLIGAGDPVITLAKDYGIETVLAAETLTVESLAASLQPKIDPAALNDACAEPPNALLKQGVDQFNAGEYYECHETLETAWREEPRPVRDLYRAILQVGLAYYQIERSSYHGALKMFLRAQGWLAGLPDRCHGLDVAGLRQDAQIARAHLESLGETHIADFDRTLMRPIRYEKEFSE